MSSNDKGHRRGVANVAVAPHQFRDIFKIGIGPSSSHTVGPMIAACRFARALGACEHRVRRIHARACGSLAWTGIGHCTDRAILLGLTGRLPDEIHPDEVDRLFRQVQEKGRLRLPGGLIIPFEFERDVMLDKETVYDRHPNAVVFDAFDADNERLAHEVYFSIGGGFVEKLGDPVDVDARAHPSRYAYSSATGLLQLCAENHVSIAEIVIANNTAGQPLDQFLASVDQVADAMFACIDRGLSIDGILPGGLNVRRRAAALYRTLRESNATTASASFQALEYVSAFAMAVNEENASGGRVVTAPTNGAAGVIPAVLRYYRDLCPGADQTGIRTFMLTACAFGDLIKRRASISGAEVGCQGEVGSAAAMAAAGLASALGGTAGQIENAAEIAMEHHLGLTCDPVGGLVQIPCIERNAFGAVKAIGAATLALRGGGEHVVSFDQVVETMRQTGRDMNEIYRETSRGGLAVNVPEC